MCRARLTIAAAESCTGGLIAAGLTAHPGASEYFLGGVVAYSREVKVNVLGVPEDVIDRYGMVSEEVALVMARGICKLTGAEIGIAATGLAGPDGDGSDIPVGTVCIALYNGSGTAQTHLFTGTREQVRQAAAKKALEMLNLY